MTVSIGYRLRRTHRRVAIVLVVLSVWVGTGIEIGCVPPPVYLNGSQKSAAKQVAAEQPASYDDRSWAAVLRQNVKDGLVDYDHLAAHREPLDEYRRTVARVSPEVSPNLFATRQSRLCFYINTYNAGVLAAVLHAKIPPTVHDLKFGSLEYRYHLLVGGRWLKLAELRQRAMKEAKGDMRVVFALCDAAVGSPPLDDQPFRPQGLDEQLRRLAAKAMDNPRIVTVDHEHQTLNVATWLATRRDKFIAYDQRQGGTGGASMLNVVLHFAGKVRRDWLNTAAGYPERMIPFDRALNRWHAPDGPSSKPFSEHPSDRSYRVSLREPRAAAFMRRATCGPRRRARHECRGSDTNET